MMKKYKIKIGTKTYSTSRRSSYILGLLCKFILTRRRIKRFIKRNMKENKIIFYMFLALIIIYSLFFLINIKINYEYNKIYQNYFAFLWEKKDIFIESIIIVLFFNILTSENNRKKGLNQRFELCTSIQIYINNFLASLNYYEVCDLKNVDIKSILSNIPALDESIIDELIKENKEIINSIISKFDLIDEMENDNRNDEKEMIIREINCLYGDKISDIQKIEIICNTYSLLFNYFYSIWSMDEHINDIIKSIFPTLEYY